MSDAKWDEIPFSSTLKPNGDDLDHMFDVFWADGANETELRKCSRVGDCVC